MAGAANTPVLLAKQWVIAHFMRFATDRRLSAVGLMLLTLSLLIGFCSPLLLLVFPGILVLHLPWWQGRYLSDLLVVATGTSLAFWIVTFWFLPYVQLPLSVWAYGVLTLTALLTALA